MQARITRPFTSISQAPQLPPRHPVGMLTPAVADRARTAVAQENRFGQ